MADDQYHALQQSVINLQYKFHDLTAGSQRPEVMTLQSEIHHLVDDIEQRKNPHTIEDRVKNVQNLLEQSQHAADPAIHQQNFSFLHSSFDQVRQSLHGFEHY